MAEADKQLVHQAACGNKEAFADLVRKYSNAVYGVAYSVVKDFHAAQDIAQDAFVKAWNHLEQLQDAEKFGSWMISITRNLSKDQFRKKQLEWRPLDEAMDVPDEKTLEDWVNRKSDEQAVWEAIGKLDEKYRTVTLMYYIGGFNAREISRMLDVPLRTTESRLRRVKDILKKELIELTAYQANEKQLGEAFVEKVKARIKGASFVLLVANLQEATAFYEGIGFTSENIGGHIHMDHGGATFILHEAKQPSDVRPNSSVLGGLYFDAFCYTDPQGLRQLYDTFMAQNVEIVNGPNWTDGWSEMTIRDNNGYRIAFGG